MVRVFILKRDGTGSGYNASGTVQDDNVELYAVLLTRAYAEELSGDSYRAFHSIHPNDGVLEFAFVPESYDSDSDRRLDRFKEMSYSMDDYPEYSPPSISRAAQLAYGYLRKYFGFGGSGDNADDSETGGHDSGIGTDTGSESEAYHDSDEY